MALWQPKSVLQWVLIGFFVAVAPLGIAILFTIQTLDQLSVDHRRMTAEVITLTRSGQELQRDLIDTERLARQYLTLQRPSLLALFEQEKALVNEQLQHLDGLTAGRLPVVATLRQLISEVALANESTTEQPLTQATLISQFDKVSQQRQALRNGLKNHVDQLQQQSEQEADGIKDALLVQVFSLVSATLLLLLLLIDWINRPVQSLVREIKLLADGDLSRAVKISGPEELKVLGRELEQLRSRLHDLDLQKQRFLRHISHEFKTPLANLREGADLLEERVPGPLTQAQLEIVEILQHNSIELQRLIENLLDYNQLPEQALELETIELESLWQELLANYRIALDKRNLTINCQGVVDTWVADRVKLKTALDNLLSNAVSYTPADGHIEIRWLPCEEGLQCDLSTCLSPFIRVAPAGPAH